MTDTAPISSTLLLPSLLQESSASKADDAEEFQTLFAQLLRGMNSNGGLVNGFPFELLLFPLLERAFDRMAEQSVQASEPSGLPLSGPITQVAHAGHMATDFGVFVGTPVKATMDGKVVYAGWSSDGYGNVVILENGPYRTYYAHLSKIPVQTGQTVRRGDTIGLSGNTGNSTGPHLHYEIRKNGIRLDPQTTFAARAV